MNCFYALFFFGFLASFFPGFEAIGINYGLMGDNLPSPGDVISLLNSRNVSKIRIFEPDQDVLEAMKDSGISVIIGTRNEDLETLASGLSAATTWVETNVLPFSSSLNITCISAGNEVFPGESTQYIPDAMENLDSALIAANLNIPVTTAVSMAIFTSTYPPSKGVFSDKASPIMTQISNFLESKQYPLIVNVYTYYPLVSDPKNIPLDYALLDDSAKPNPDGEFIYRNLLDSMLDSVYAALEKAGGPNVEVVVGETGWPTEGNDLANIENAKRYNSNLIKHVASGSGTPRRPGKDIEAYIFALFNEDLKLEGVEQHWGLFYPDMTEVYHLDL